jgi:hypothetical protein
VYEYYVEDEKAIMHDITNGNVNIYDGLGTEQGTQQDGFDIDVEPFFETMPSPWMVMPVMWMRPLWVVPKGSPVKIKAKERWIQGHGAPLPLSVFDGD